MPIHGLEPAAEHGAFLDFVPVVKHQSVLDRAADFFFPTWNHLLLVHVNSFGNRGVGVADVFQAFQKARYVAYAVIEALAAI